MPRWGWWLGALGLALLTGPRLPYLAEWLPGAGTLAQGDDFGRLAELISMTQSERYPLVHPANQSYLLSHYYTAFYPMAWMKMAAPFLTLKDCIVAGNFLYHALMLGALLECAPRLVRRRRGALTLVFLVTLFGGFDLLVAEPLLFSHCEQWPVLRMARFRQISSFFTATFWTAHHMAAVWAAILTYVLARETRFAAPWRKLLVLGGLMATVAATSAFVAITLPLVAWKEMWTLGRRLIRRPVLLALLGAALATPAWLMLRRVETQGFFWHPPPWNIALYVAAICVVDLAGIPFWVTLKWKELAGQERRWLLGFWVFLISTWGLESVGYNNYMMRGGLVPVAAVMVVFARHGAPRWLLTLVLATTLTTLHEAGTLAYWGVEYSNWYWQMRGRAMPVFVQKRFRPEYARIARDPSIRYYQPVPRDRNTIDKYNAEKLVQGLTLKEMLETERELARYRD